MSGRRLAGTVVVMAAVAVALRALTPSPAEMTDAVLTAQRTVDTAGADALLVATAGLLAWAVWGWGALGLLVTAASALPGTVGAAADVLTGVVLPGGARRGAALALGVGLGVAGPVAGTALPLLDAPAAAAGSPSAAVPDWPVADTRALPDRPTATSGGVGAPTVPDWPTAPGPSAAGDEPAIPGAPVAGDHVVVRGDCLWDIAAERLTARLGRVPASGEIARAVHDWWTANAAVIGPDPDLLLPGQVLHPPP